jgi:hypothetical protein
MFLSAELVVAILAVLSINLGCGFLEEGFLCTYLVTAFS